MKLLAKSKQGNFYKVLESDDELSNLIEDKKRFFEFDSNIVEIDFIQNPTWKLDKKTPKDDSTKDEWFSVDYSKNAIIKDVVEEYKNIFKSSAECSNLTSNNINKISFLINAKKAKEKYSINIQVVKNTSYIRSRQFLKLGSDKARYKREENILNLDDNIDIHISETDNKIYFKKLADMKKINEVFADLYKESTKEELDLFTEKVAQCSMFSMKEFSIQERNSKNIKYALDNNKVNFLRDKNKIDNYIKKYPTNLNKDDKGLYEIHSNKDLTNFLKVINEHYYEGEITGNRMESNSSKVLLIQP
ncbi:hypothetical protein [uncultured Gammaproteobacteria bacterium]|nr:hypothetical protein [uncultured Gammaproteobacteria bacterium]